ncbi:otogelin [Genypterus blacodes]|uniref:otogelin n=1 Tax=Genypterus blacodes TaxID=154954 RepID=UPI003F764EE6
MSNLTSISSQRTANSTQTLSSDQSAAPTASSSKSVGNIASVSQSLTTRGSAKQSSAPHSQSQARPSPNSTAPLSQSAVRTPSSVQSKIKTTTASQSQGNTASSRHSSASQSPKSSAPVNQSTGSTAPTSESPTRTQSFSQSSTRTPPASQSTTKTAPVSPSLIQTSPASQSPHTTAPARTLFDQIPASTTSSNQSSSQPSVQSASNNTLSNQSPNSTRPSNQSVSSSAPLRSDESTASSTSSSQSSSRQTPTNQSAVTTLPANPSLSIQAPPGQPPTTLKPANLSSTQSKPRQESSSSSISPNQSQTDLTPSEESLNSSGWSQQSWSSSGAPEGSAGGPPFAEQHPVNASSLSRHLKGRLRPWIRRGTDGCTFPCLNGGQCVQSESCDCSLYQATGQRCQTVPNTGFEREMTCRTWGQYNFETFDGLYYYFPGRCSYTLLRDCEETTQASIVVQVHNDPNCGSTPYTCQRSVSVFLPSQGEVRLHAADVTFKGQSLQLPHHIHDVRLEQISQYVLVTQQHGFTLAWDGQSGSVYIKLSPEFVGRTCGLCGNFNADVQDDLKTSYGVLTHDLEMFGNSWLEAEPHQVQCPNVPPGFLSPCASVNAHLLLKVEEVCAMLLEAPFHSCHDFVSPLSYMASCSNDLCKSGPNGDVVCQVFSEYARACAHADHPLHDWRRHIPRCEVPCPAGLQYRECISCCPASCNLERTCIDSKLACLDGCYCPEGLIYEDGACVMPSDCPCEYHGMFYLSGQMLQEECNNCTCVGGVWNCTDYSCPAECSVTGDMYFQSFDGRMYTFRATCHYVLAKSRTSGKFTVTIQNAPCGANLDGACIQSVSLLIDEDPRTEITLSHVGEVFMAGQYRISLPYSDDVFHIQELSSMFLQVKTTLGLRLQYNWKEFRLYLQADEMWRDDTVGLCGTFNGNIQDDFLSPSGMIESTPTLFGNAWKVSSACSSNLSPPQLDPCDTHQQAASYSTEMCDILNQELFSACHEYLSPTPFHQQCRSDTCKCGTPCLCSALAHYARHCRRFSIIIDFRSYIPDCAVTCPTTMQYGTCVSSCQRRCSALSVPQHCGEECEEGCVCPDGSFYNLRTHTCVHRNECPCSFLGAEYDPGDVIMTSAGVQLCLNGKLLSQTTHSDRLCPVGQLYQNCSEGDSGLLTGRGMACGGTCESYLLNLTCSAHEPCVPGCVCPAGLLKHGDECFLPASCPCLWKGKEYYPGDRVSSPCHQCVCQHGTFQCVFRPCPSMCTAYGDRHYRTFDGVLFDYVGACKVYLVKSSADLMLSVTAENFDCFDSGVICRKSLLINIGRSLIAFDDDSGKPNPSSVIDKKQRMLIWPAGFFTVVHFPVEEVTILWDRKTTVHIQVGPRWQGKLSGLCGNFDLKTVNEMRTPDNIDSPTPQEFGNSWTATECVNSPDIRHPCSLSPLREPFAKRKCAVLLSEVFQACHAVVDVTWFYMNCLADTCACNRGGDCECFCTSVAAYAQRCCHQGVPVDWRTPSMCPYDCEFYNKVLGKGPFRLIAHRDQTSLLTASRSSGSVFLQSDPGAAAGVFTQFMMTPGLSRSRPHDTSRVSFEAADRPNYFLYVNPAGSLKLAKWEESETFWDGATFVLHRNTWIPGYDSLESHTKPGFFLHATPPHLYLLKYRHNVRFRKATMFKLTGLGPESLPGPRCQWRYDSCVNPCFKTCSDPTAEACVTIPQVEGCIPACPPHMVLDEVTHRCVHVEDCIIAAVAVPSVTPSSAPSTSASVTNASTASVETHFSNTTKAIVHPHTASTTPTTSTTTADIVQPHTASTTTTTTTTTTGATGHPHTASSTTTTSTTPGVIVHPHTASTTTTTPTTPGVIVHPHTASTTTTTSITTGDIVHPHTVSTTTTTSATTTAIVHPHTVSTTTTTSPTAGAIIHSPTVSTTTTTSTIALPAVSTQTTTHKVPPAPDMPTQTISTSPSVPPEIPSTTTLPSPPTAHPAVKPEFAKVPEVPPITGTGTTGWMSSVPSSTFGPFDSSPFSTSTQPYSMTALFWLTSATKPPSYREPLISTTASLPSSTKIPTTSSDQWPTTTSGLPVIPVHSTKEATEATTQSAHTLITTTSSQGPASVSEPSVVTEKTTVPSTATAVSTDSSTKPVTVERISPATTTLTPPGIPSTMATTPSPVPSWSPVETTTVHLTATTSAKTKDSVTPVAHFTTLRTTPYTSSETKSPPIPVGTTERVLHTTPSKLATAPELLTSTPIYVAPTSAASTASISPTSDWQTTKKVTPTSTASAISETTTTPFTVSQLKITDTAQLSTSTAHVESTSWSAAHPTTERTTQTTTARLPDVSQITTATTGPPFPIKPTIMPSSFTETTTIPVSPITEVSTQAPSTVKTSEPWHPPHWETTTTPIYTTKDMSKPDVTLETTTSVVTSTKTTESPDLPGTTQPVVTTATSSATAAAATTTSKITGYPQTSSSEVTTPSTRKPVTQQPPTVPGAPETPLTTVPTSAPLTVTTTLTPITVKPVTETTPMIGRVEVSTSSATTPSPSVSLLLTTTSTTAAPAPTTHPPVTTRLVSTARATPDSTTMSTRTTMSRTTPRVPVTTRFTSKIPVTERTTTRPTATRVTLSTSPAVVTTRSTTLGLPTVTSSPGTTTVHGTPPTSVQPAAEVVTTGSTTKHSFVTTAVPSQEVTESITEQVPMEPTRESSSSAKVLTTKETDVSPFTTKPQTPSPSLISTQAPGSAATPGAATTTHLTATTALHTKESDIWDHTSAETTTPPVSPFKPMETAEVTTSTVTSTTRMCTPPYAEFIDECTKYICVNNQLVLFNKSQSCPFSSDPPNCGLLGFAVLINGDKCCPQWDCPCRCSVFPDLNVITFDGNIVAIYKAASYIVAQLPNETVSILVQECPADSESPLLWNFTNLCLVALSITHQSDHIFINRLQRRLYVNSRYAKPRFKKYGFEIYDTGNMYLIRSPAGLKLQWYHSTGMMVIDTDSNKLQTMGLCGFCDGDPTNDLTLANGTIVGQREDPAVFIDSWQVPNTTSYISHSRRREVNCSTSDCSHCLAMLQEHSFFPCHAFVSPSTFCEVWVRDADYVNNHCVALAAYVASCHKFNICIEWRRPDYCPFMCPDALRYQACLPACTAQSCPNQDFDSDPDQCSGLTEGCVCPEGTLLHRPYSALCISPDKCACTDSAGVPRAHGEVWKASVDGCCMYRCDNDTITPVEYNCSSVASPVCRRAGETVISMADDTSCCPQKFCVCNQSLCDLLPPECKYGEKLVSYFRQNSCCPDYVCECDPELCELDIPSCREDQTLIATKADGSCCLAHICMCLACAAPPACQDGEVMTVDGNTTDRCCPAYHCVCEPYRCPQLSCPDGTSVVSEPTPGRCCPNQTCECACDKIPSPKCSLGETTQLDRTFPSDPQDKCACRRYKCVSEAVCVYGERGVLRPGQTLVEHGEDGLCHSRQCSHSLDPSSGFHLLRTSSTNCSAQCQPNQIYISPKDQSMCCGVCKNISCLHKHENGTTMLHKPGKSWVSNCMKFDCTDTLSGPTLISYNFSCPPFNESECMKVGGTVVSYMDGCCKTCKEDGKSCQKVTVRMTIRKNDCRSNRPVNIVSCDGKCPSASIYNYNINTYARFCKCCREMGLQQRSVQLYCSGNTTWVNYNIQEPTDCSCQWS